MSTMNSGTSIQTCNMAATNIDTNVKESDGEDYEEEDREQLVVAVVFLINGFRIQKRSTPCRITRNKRNTMLVLLRTKDMVRALSRGKRHEKHQGNWGGGAPLYSFCSIRGR
jgi:hypothetical protein